MATTGKRSSTAKADPSGTPAATKPAAKKAPAAKDTKTGTPAKQASARKPASKKGTAKSAAKPAPRTAAKKSEPEKDSAGGLTAAGRAAFAKKEGAHLRPGVQGPANTPDKQLRKGSFLRRHFANPRGPMERDGEPTRLALSAHAWGEPVPKTPADAKKLADKGSELLEQYHEGQEKGKAQSPPTKRTPAKKSAAKNDTE